VIIVHSKNDHDIPYTHSEDLFNTRIKGFLPDASEALSKDSESVKVNSVTIEKLGTIKTSEKMVNGTLQKTVLLITETGGHNRINGFGSVLEVIRRVIGVEAI